MPNTLWGLGGLGFVLARILSRKLWRWVALKRQKPYTNSVQPPIYGVGGGLFIATRQPELDAHVFALEFYLIGRKVRAVVSDHAMGTP